MIPLLRPSCTEAEIAAVTAALRSGWWGQGPRCEEFERRLAQHYGRKHCVTTNSATAALHLALLAHGVGAGDEVILPALTFVSTALAVTYTGAKPVFADVEEDTLCLDWDAVGWLCGPRTKAIIPVDYAGYPAMEGKPDGPVIVQDAAHSCGGVGYGDEVCLSFHPVKNLATGDGGAVLTDADERAERMRALRWCGINRSTWERTGKRYAWDYDIAEVGFKCHLNDIQAAIGLAQLERLGPVNRRRREIARNYLRAFADLPDVRLPAAHSYHTWHLFVIRVATDKRDALIDYLGDRGISTGVHYKPLTYYPMYADQKTPPVTEREWHRLVSLPLFPDLSEGEQDQVIEAVRAFCCGTRRY